MLHITEGKSATDRDKVISVVLPRSKNNRNEERDQEEEGGITIRGAASANPAAQGSSHGGQGDKSLIQKTPTTIDQGDPLIT